MANWVNVQLDVRGLPIDVEHFRRAAGAKVGRINTARSKVFTLAMEHGEAADLEADPIERFGDRFRTASYRFQGRYDDHVDHFQKVSRRFPKLAFVLAYSDPNCDDHGSYLLLRGTRRTWVVPYVMRVHILRKALVRYGLPADLDTSSAEGDEVFWAENEAYWEMQELAARRWEKVVMQWLKNGSVVPAGRKPRPTARDARGRRRSTSRSAKRS